jgi:hypothetical protein
MGRKRKALPDQALLLAILSYDEMTGLLTWRYRSVEVAAAHGLNPKSVNNWNSKYAGTAAHTTLIHGYIGVTITGIHYMAHRVIWKMVHGTDPDFVDHINGKTSDNRIENLRDVSALENQRNRKTNRNNTSGYSGVNFCRTTGKYLARIDIGSGSKNLGRFNTLEEAIAARKSAETSMNYRAARRA